MHKPEYIPDSAELYRRIHPKSFDPKRRKIDLSAFILREKDKGGLSVDWEKYSTPEKTAICPISKKKFYVGGVLAKLPRRERLTVRHDPKKNRAHTLIEGDRLINEDEKQDIAFILAENCRHIITEI